MKEDRESAQFGRRCARVTDQRRGRPRQSWPLLVCLGLLCWASSSRALIERSTDDDGVITLSSRPVPVKQTASTKKASLSRQAVMPAAGGVGRAGRYEAHIQEAAALYHLPAALIRAVMKVESNFDPRALSPANAHGLMQLLPGTAERMMVTDIFDPRQNILGGARYLRVLANTFNGDLQLTLAGYNAGEGAVAKYGGIPPYPETQHYVARVVEYYRAYSVE
jgi:soluble lytic murein transglycosylase-like protein